MDSPPDPPTLQPCSVIFVPAPSISLRFRFVHAGSFHILPRHETSFSASELASAGDRAFLFFIVFPARVLQTLFAEEASISAKIAATTIHIVQAHTRAHGCSAVKVKKMTRVDTHQPKRFKNIFFYAKTAKDETKCKRNMADTSQCKSWAQDEVKGSSLEAIFACFESSGLALEEETHRPRWRCVWARVCPVLSGNTC